MKNNQALLLLVLSLLSTTAWAHNGTLKVNSFPDGAQVIIDGSNTGKVTPMSTSLSLGEHTVVVTIPGGGWQQDSRTVTILSGNNDLSVTLLPSITQGPPGPQGPQGPAEPQGPPGPAAGSDDPSTSCQIDEFMSGNLTLTLPLQDLIGTVGALEFEYGDFRQS